MRSSWHTPRDEQCTMTRLKLSGSCGTDSATKACQTTTLHYQGTHSRWHTVQCTCDKTVSQSMQTTTVDTTSLTLAPPDVKNRHSDSTSKRPLQVRMYVGYSYSVPIEFISQLSQLLGIDGVSLVGEAGSMSHGKLHANDRGLKAGCAATHAATSFCDYPYVFYTPLWNCSLRYHLTAVWSLRLKPCFVCSPWCRELACHKCYTGLQHGALQNS